MDEAGIVSIIGQVGFPIAVAVYLLVKMDKTIKGLQDVISQNTLVLTKFMDRVEGGNSGK